MSYTTHNSDDAAIVSREIHINELDINKCWLLINTLQNSINCEICITYTLLCSYVFAGTRSVNCRILAIPEEHIHLFDKCMCHMLCSSVLLNLLTQIIS
jgi:hypothetical protein